MFQILDVRTQGFQAFKVKSRDREVYPVSIDQAIDKGFLLTAHSAPFYLHRQSSDSKYLVLVQSFEPEHKISQIVDAR
jgi:hypothetical protein